TPAIESVKVLEALQSAFVAHAVAHGSALRDVLGATLSPRALGMIVRTIVDEHRDQARALAALALAGPGTHAWRARARDLRARLVDHATREEFMRASLSDHVSAESRRALASKYATERLRRLVDMDRGTTTFSVN